MLQIGGSTIHNAEDGFLAGSSDTENLEEIIAKSHNVGAAEVGLRIGRTTMYDMMRRFGFGDTTDVGLPGENAGIVPELDEWSATSLPTMAFGHGVAITPLALARAYCAIANGGLLATTAHPRGDPRRRRPRRLPVRSGNRAARHLAAYGGDLAPLFCAPSSCAVRATRRRRWPATRRREKPARRKSPKTATTRAGKYVASFVGFIPAEEPRFVDPREDRRAARRDLRRRRRGARLSPSSRSSRCCTRASFLPARAWFERADASKRHT